jgi:hypothetical protein
MFENTLGIETVFLFGTTCVLSRADILGGDQHPPERLFMAGQDGPSQLYVEAATRKCN